MSRTLCSIPVTASCLPQSARRYITRTQHQISTQHRVTPYSSLWTARALKVKSGLRGSADKRPRQGTTTSGATRNLSSSPAWQDGRSKKSPFGRSSAASSYAQEFRDPEHVKYHLDALEILAEKIEKKMDLKMKAARKAKSNNDDTAVLQHEHHVQYLWLLLEDLARLGRIHTHLRALTESDDVVEADVASYREIYRDTIGLWTGEFRKFAHRVLADGRRTHARFRIRGLLRFGAALVAGTPMLLGLAMIPKIAEVCAREGLRGQK